MQDKYIRTIQHGTEILSFTEPKILFHLMIVDEKNEFLKKLWFALRRGMFSAFLVGYNVGLTGIKLKRY